MTSGEMISGDKIPLHLNSGNVGDVLFLEALRYKNLDVIDVGKHVSCFLSGTELHIHFRRNLDQIVPSDFESPIAYAKAFSQEIGNDLSQLSALLTRNDPRFAEITLVIGLTGLGAAWGRSHGWKTETYTVDRQVIDFHESTIENKPIETKPSKLTIFTISREDHIKNFPPPELSSESSRDTLER
jgi:hypothetical protein